MPFNLDAVRDDIRSGMPHEVRACWDDARANLDYYRMRNRAYLEDLARKEAEDARDWESRPKQYSRLTRRAVNCLTSKLYSPGPQRLFEGGPAAADVEAIYREARIDAVMTSLDRMATLNGVAAVQAVATGKPEAPIRLYLWDRSEFHAYCPDDDPTSPAAVVTKTVVAGVKRGTKRRKWEVWTPDVYEVWFGRDFNPFEGCRDSWDGTTAAQRGPSEANPYGVIPFAYAWHELPVDRFDVEGLGTALREANGEVDRMMTDLADLLSAYNRPKGFVRNVSAAWRFAEKTGRFTRLPKDGDKDDSHGPPEPFYLQPLVDVPQAWEAIHNLIDETFTDLDIPLEAAKGSARMMSGADSGIALAIRNEPLRAYVEARRPAFGLYERDVARMVATVYGNYYDRPEVASAASTLELELTWPEVTFGPPGQDQQAADQWSYQMGLDSRITILMRQRGWSRDQAVEHLEQVAEDRAVEAKLMPEDAEPAGPTDPNGQQQQQQQQPDGDGGDPEAGPGERDDQAGE